MKQYLLKYYLIVLISTFHLKGKAQLFFLQDNIHGGASFDGISYANLDCLQADSISFSNTIPSGAVVKKSYLLTLRTPYQVGEKPKKDVSLEVDFNNHILAFDSSTIVTQSFYCDYSIPSGENWLCALDVTLYTLNNNNVLKTPCQACLMSLDTARRIVYNSFVLLVLYENPSMPLVNIAVFLNNKTYTNNLQYFLGNINPVNNTEDVGLSAWSNSVYNTPTMDYRIDYTLNSSIGNFYLGKLDMSIGNFTFKKTLPGSFFYENNILAGLVDDSPDGFMDSTDALANIKAYLSNNTTTFSVTTNGITTATGGHWRLGFILAYTTPCPASVSKDTSIAICKGQSIQLNATTGFTNYNWYPLAGLNDSTIVNPLATPQLSTNYIAYVKDAAGCMHTEHAQIIVHGVPEPDSIKISNAVCATNLGSLLITPNYHNYQPYTYNIGSGATTDTSITNITPGSYTLTVTDNAGCMYQTDFEIDEIIPVNASITALPTSGTQPLSVGFFNNSSGANNYNWHFPTNIATSTNANYTFTEAGTYTVVLVSYKNNLSCSDTATVVIQVLPKDTSGVFIPNVFSPNGDGINETLEFKMKNVELQGLEIYDRWGVLIFSTNELQKTSFSNLTTVFWDGRTTSGEPCSEGTYFYVFNVKDEKATLINYKGFITLVR